MEISISPLLSLLLSFLFFLILVYRKLCCSPATRELRPPSPPKLPLIGNLHQLGRLPHRSLHALAQTHGPLILLHLGSIPTLVVSSATAAEEILKTHDLVFSGRPSLEPARRIFYGSKGIVFSPQSEEWRKARKICVLHLLRSKKVQSFRAVREEEVSLLVNAIARRSPSAPVNLSEMLSSLSSSVISRATLGNKYSSSARGGTAFYRLVVKTSLLFGGFYVRDYFPWLGWLSRLTGSDMRLDSCFRLWDALLDDVLRDHEDGHDLVDVLLGLDQDQGFALTRDDIKAILQNLLLAATDTTYIAMEWTMAELVRSPASMKRVQDEIREATKASMVGEDDISGMVYLKAAIKEALRLHPPAPLLVPHESTAAVGVHGYQVPASTRVFVNCWSIGRDPEYWAEPDEFRPERFLGSGVDFWGLDFHFVPFGAGRRMCPGMQFALSTMELALANLLYRFDWSLPDGKEPAGLDMEEAPGLTTRMESNLLLVATPYMVDGVHH